MASNPYELRWEVYTRAEDLLKERYEAEVLAYESRKEQGLETGKYPSFPSESLIYATAQNMKNWYEDREFDIKSLDFTPYSHSILTKEEQEKLKRGD